MLSTPRTTTILNGIVNYIPISKPENTWNQKGTEICNPELLDGTSTPKWFGNRHDSLSMGRDCADRESGRMQAIEKYRCLQALASLAWRKQ